MIRIIFIIYDHSQKCDKMDMKEWKIFYDKIMDDFKFNKDMDVESAIILDKILEYGDNKADINKINEIIHGNDVIIFGAGPSIKKHIDLIKKEKLLDYPIIVADGACKAFLEEGIIPDIIVSDLDGHLDALLECNKKGSIVVVHAHGDNIKKIIAITPKLKNVVGSCQIPQYKERGLKNVINFGGFTDGDRCCFLAHYFNAKKLILGGMDFGRYITNYSRPEIEEEVAEGDEIKIKKLEYAKQLINYLSKKIEIEYLK